MSRSVEQFVLFVGVDIELFKFCFGDDKKWSPFELRDFPLPTTAGSAQSLGDDLRAVLDSPGLSSVVIQDADIFMYDHVGVGQAIKQYYDRGGIVCYFGIMGEHSDLAVLNTLFDLNGQWQYMACTSHEYEMTNSAQLVIGYEVMRQQYTKSNLLRVPIQDRWMVDKYEQCPLAVRKNSNGGRLAYLGFVNGDGNIPRIVKSVLTKKYQY
mmetsp:Transcript_13864/g.33292  ORF Transcript_13864/g.33292 Transcript_13864/m.33292 type:complete len:210 (+) Transcript_13864:161-790(+)|eukprot:CAMPEP_0113470354 /NCGR_PEP_ID=MMETSP0014_2-20120614/16397_1 /TAXON_ID=2857 /ORGANISM="Nitzschia sp." /LENGTH=209 /DNA_ID=CAMNT_0000362911 /DNA_START=81 /DNA_END=710 /DNA_ORIENTATION=+ /assembly_acc=CAM_ASM_000159